MPVRHPVTEKRMGRSGKKEGNPKEDLLRNRRKIQSCEAQITENNLLIQQYGEQYDQIRSAIGNLDTVISNIEGIQKYAYHVFNSCNNSGVEWRGQEYRYTDAMVFNIDTDMNGYKKAVDFEQLEAAMKNVRDATEKIHIINFQFVQRGKCDIPSYTRLREQLDTLNVLSQRTKNIMESATGNVTRVYTELCNTDGAIQETLENG